MKERESALSGTCIITTGTEEARVCPNRVLVIEYRNFGCNDGLKITKPLRSRPNTTKQFNSGKVLEALEFRAWQCTESTLSLPWNNKGESWYEQATHIRQIGYTFLNCSLLVRSSRSTR